MLFNVPQFIDVEDKIVGPFTGRQLLWMFGLGAVLLVLWNILEKTPFFISAVIISLIFVALAFYRPYNQPLITFIASAILFLFRPKTYFWERDAISKTSTKKIGNKLPTETTEKKFITPEELEGLAATLNNNQNKINNKGMDINVKIKH